MPNLKSAEKRMRQYAKRNLRNRMRKNAAKTQVKKVVEAISQNNVETAEKELILAEKALMKMGAKRVIHPKAASRKTGRLAKKIHALKTKGQTK